MIRLPSINSLGSVQKPAIQAFTQLNRKDYIADNEIAEGTNLSSRKFPVLTCRPSRAIITSGIVSPEALFAANGKLAYVAGTSFVYDGAVKGAVTAGQKSMVDFNGKIIIIPDKKYYDYTTGTFGTFGGGTYPAAGSAPDMDFIASHMNRLFGVKGNNFYGTALGEYDDWTTGLDAESEEEQNNMDAYAVDRVEPGDFVGIVEYQQHLNLFKPGYMYENYGAYPQQYTLQLISKTGCMDGRSIAEVKERLFFLSSDGKISVYSGSVPKSISDNLNYVFKAGIAETDGRYYYLSAQLQDDTWRLLVYDVEQGIWMPEDDLQVIDFARIENTVYALDADGNIIQFNSGSEAIAWELYTKKFDDGLMGKKEVFGLRIQADLATGSTMSVYISLDDGAFSLIKTFTAENKYKNYKAIYSGRKAARYQYKITVSGEADIYGFRREFVVGGDI